MPKRDRRGCQQIGRTYGKITTEKIGDELREDITKYTSKALPMIIEVPDKSGSHKRETDPMNELIKRVIGVEMVK